MEFELELFRALMERESEKAGSPKVGEGAFILLHKIWPLEGCLIPATPEVPPVGSVLPVLSSSSVNGLRRSPVPVGAEVPLVGPVLPV